MKFISMKYAERYFFVCFFIKSWQSFNQTRRTTFITNFHVLKISKCAKDISKYFFSTKQRANFKITTLAPFLEFKRLCH